MNNKGVAGFFEDLPALLIVILALAIFMGSSINAILTYRARERESDRTTDLGEKILESVLSCPHLVKDGRKDGTFDLGKLRNMTDEKMKRYLHTDLNYEIRVVDVSDYPKKENFNFTVAEHPANHTEVAYLKTYDYPINIYTPIEAKHTQTCVHGAVLYLKVWT